MNKAFYGRSFLTLLDFTSEEITYLLDLAEKLNKPKTRQRNSVLQQKISFYYLKRLHQNSLRL